MLRAVLDVPSGTQPGSVLRLAGKGLPVFGTAGRGDLYVTIAVRVPKELSHDERALWEQLRASGSRRRKRNTAPHSV